MRTIEDGRCDGYVRGWADEDCRRREAVLFLDVDGVLNSTRFMVACARAGTWDHKDPRDWTCQLDPAAVALLSTVVARTGCAIVISSSWRHAHPPGRIGRFLRNAGLAGDVIGATPYHLYVGEKYMGRAAEIRNWLGHHRWVRRYAVVDDGSDAGVGMEDHFVKTKLSIGLTAENADEIVSILNGGDRG